jgi:hypothetical protein
MQKVTMTHKGWFGLCPIYLNDVGTDCPTLEPRFRYTGWLLSLSTSVYGALFRVATAVDPYYQPLWPIHITGELKTPIEVEVEAE